MKSCLMKHDSAIGLGPSALWGRFRIQLSLTRVCFHSTHRWDTGSSDSLTHINCAPCVNCFPWVGSFSSTFTQQNMTVWQLRTGDVSFVWLICTSIKKCRTVVFIMSTFTENANIKRCYYTITGGCIYGNLYFLLSTLTTAAFTRDTFRSYLSQ